MKKKIAINASNLIHGGGAQIATWFVSELLKRKDLNFEFILFLSEQVSQNVNSPKNITHVIPSSPVRSLKYRKYIESVLKEEDIGLVFSILGPSGLRTDVREVSGLANAWITSCDLKFNLKIYGLVAGFISYVRNVYLKHLSCNSDCLIFESESTRSDFINSTSFKYEDTIVIPTTANNDFFSCNVTQPNVEKVKILYISTFAPHKNMDKLANYAQALKNDATYDFKFILTLPDHDFVKVKVQFDLLDCSDFIENIGFVKPEDLKSLYDSISVVISPSELETFSACYCESMLSGRVLLASDREFSRSICGDDVFYFEPSDAESFLYKFKEAMCYYNAVSAEDIRQNGLRRFIKPTDRFDSVLSVIDKFN